MKVFFDMEFTGLHQHTTPISIGLVSMEGDVFYGEFSDYDSSQCDEFIKNEVLSNLLNPENLTNGGKMLDVAKRVASEIVKTEMLFRQPSVMFKYGNKDHIKQHLLKWLKQFDTVEWVSDVCHYDFVLLIDILFGNALSVPKNMGVTCYDINYDIAKYCDETLDYAFDISREDICTTIRLRSHPSYIPNFLPKHNSLYDAFVIRNIYKYLHKLHDK